MARPEARVLCWLCEPDEFAMIDAFVATEDEPDIARTEDLFVPLDAPFAAGRYGAALLAEFTEKAAALHAGLEDESVKPWEPPAVAPGAQDPQPFLQACQSFIEHYQLPGLLALYLTPPAEVSDMGALLAWRPSSSTSPEGSTGTE